MKNNMRAIISFESLFSLADTGKDVVVVTKNRFQTFSAVEVQGWPARGLWSLIENLSLLRREE